jgi:hypothetical protein
MIFKAPIEAVATPSLETVDEWNADVLRNAVSFTASLFLGAAHYETLDATTLEGVKEAADMLKEMHPTAKRDVIVYAFDAAGNRTILSGKPYKEPKAKAAGKKAELPKLEGAMNALFGAPEKGAAKAAKKPAVAKAKATGEKAAAKKEPKAAKEPKPAKEPKAPKPAVEKKAKGPSKWDAARELLVRPEGVQKEALFAVLKWRSMSIPLLLAQTKLASVVKIEGGWKGSAEAPETPAPETEAPTTEEAAN